MSHLTVSNLLGKEVFENKDAVREVVLKCGPENGPWQANKIVDRKARNYMSTVTLTLTPEQRKQFKDATGQDATELHLNVETKGQLSDAELGKVAGGATAQGGLGTLCCTGKHFDTVTIVC